MDCKPGDVVTVLANAVYEQDESTWNPVHFDAGQLFLVIAVFPKTVDEPNVYGLAHLPLLGFRPIWAYRNRILTLDDFASRYSERNARSASNQV